MEKKLNEKEKQGNKINNNNTNNKNNINVNNKDNLKELKEKENTIEILKNEINSLKKLKNSGNLQTYNYYDFNALEVKKQTQLFYIGGKLNYDGIYSDYGSNQKRMLKKIEDNEKKKIIKLKKIKTNKV